MKRNHHKKYTEPVYQNEHSKFLKTVRRNQRDEHEHHRIGEIPLRSVLRTLRKYKHKRHGNIQKHTGQKVQRTGIRQHDQNTSHQNKF